MKRHLVLLIVALAPLVPGNRLEAQSPDGFRIVVRASIARTDGGGDRLNTTAVIDPDATGKTTTNSFSRLVGHCGTGVAPGPAGDMAVGSGGALKKVHSAWTVQVTPTKHVDDAVTFRLQWTRSRDNGRPSTIGDDIELTLRPGQSQTLDVMPLAPEAPAPGSSCILKSLSLAVGVERYPTPDHDRRLVAVDLWLIERLEDGKERSQPLSLRGLFYQPMPFYFETLTEGTKSLDIFGDLQIRPGDRTTEIKITTRSRLIKPPAELPPPLRNMPERTQYVGSTTATLHIAPDEVVSVPLPAVGHPQSDAGAFAARALSFRIRVRQIR